MNNRKVLHLINGEFYAGAERVQDILALGLPVFGWDVEFFQLKAGRFSELRKSKCPIHAGYMRSRVDLKVVSALIKIIKARNIRILHTHTVRSLMLGVIASRICKLPLVHHCHSSEVISSKAGIIDYINKLVEKVTLAAFPDVIVAVSSGAERYLNSVGVGSAKVALICNGVPDCALAEVKLADSNHGLFEFACVALFRERKGLETLLEAAGILKQMGESFRISLVGSFETPEYFDAIKDRIFSLNLQDIVVIEGFCSNVPERVSQSNALVFPSVRSEGLPMALLEAMSVGLPIIASRVDGVTDAITDGVNGVLVTPGDAKQLAKIMEDFMRSGDAGLKSAYGIEAQKTQRDMFSVTAMSSSLALVYNRLVVD